jgi:site-specific DNA recombinase
MSLTKTACFPAWWSPLSTSAGRAGIPQCGAFELKAVATAENLALLMLTILASYAQEESRSASENQKWRIRKNFREGKPWNGTMYGYRYEDGRLVPVPGEAEIVRTIFSRYLSGEGASAIAKALNTGGVPTRLDCRWHPSAVMKILRNYAYTGNLILQKTYWENHLTKRTMVNRGELPRYHATETHEAIVPPETFEAVQAEIARRAAKFARPSGGKETYPFTGLLVCGICGKHYRRKVTAAQPVWICATYNTLGKTACASRQIPESTLTEVTAEVLGWDTADKNAPRAALTEIRAEDGNRLVFLFKDGRTAERVWKSRSQSESWTDEMRKAAGEKRREKRCQKP